MRYTTLPGTEIPGVIAARRRRRRALVAGTLLAAALVLTLIDLARAVHDAPPALTLVQTCVAVALAATACIYLHRTRTRRPRALATTRKAPHV